MPLPTADAAADADGLRLRVDPFQIPHGVDEDLPESAGVESPRGPGTAVADRHDVDSVPEVFAQLRLPAHRLPPLHPEPLVSVPFLAVESGTTSGKFPPDPEGGADGLRELGLFPGLVLLLFLLRLFLFLLRLPPRLLLLFRRFLFLLRGLVRLPRGLRRLFRHLRFLLGHPATPPRPCS